MRPCIGVAWDITELERGEPQNAFLASLNERLHDVNHAGKAVRAAKEMLGQHQGAVAGRIWDATPAPSGAPMGAGETALYIETTDAAEARPILGSARPSDLPVSDVGLPGMNGRRIAEHAVARGVPGRRDGDDHQTLRRRRPRLQDQGDDRPISKRARPMNQCARRRVMTTL